MLWTYMYIHVCNVIRHNAAELHDVCKHCCRSTYTVLEFSVLKTLGILLKMKKKFVGLLFLINMIFLFVGGVIFHVLEHPTEEKAIRDADENYEELKASLLSEFVENLC